MRKKYEKIFANHLWNHAIFSLNLQNYFCHGSAFVCSADASTGHHNNDAHTHPTLICSLLFA